MFYRNIFTKEMFINFILLQKKSIFTEYIIVEVIIKVIF